MLAAKAFERTAKLAPAAHEVFTSRPHMLEQFWVLAKLRPPLGVARLPDELRSSLDAKKYLAMQISK